MQRNPVLSNNNAFKLTFFFIVMEEKRGEDLDVILRAHGAVITKYLHKALPTTEGRENGAGRVDIEMNGNLNDFTLHMLYESQRIEIAKGSLSPAREIRFSQAVQGRVPDYYPSLSERLYTLFTDIGHSVFNGNGNLESKG